MGVGWNPNSEFLREPNLLIPGKKPVGQVKIDTGASGVILEQWIGPTHMEHGSAGELITANAEINTNVMEIITDALESGAGIEFRYGLKNTITDFPFGVFCQWLPVGGQTTTGENYGHAGLYSGAATGSSSRCCYGQRGFKDIAPNFGGQQGFNTKLSVEGGPTLWPSSGMIVVANVSYSSTDHRGYALWSNGSLTKITSTTDISSWTIIFDSLMIGSCIERSGYFGDLVVGSGAALGKHYTAGALSGSGLNEAFTLSLLHDPYQFLIPA